MENGKIVRENFELWRQALLTRNADKVAKLYSEDATFLPTMSPEFKQGVTGAKDYFVHFLKKNPDGKVIQEEIRSLGDKVYLHSGRYDFEIGKDGCRETVPARFTFVWRRKPSGKWEIIHHHSSLKP